MQTSAEGGLNKDIAIQDQNPKGKAVSKPRLNMKTKQTVASMGKMSDDGTFKNL